MSRKDVVDGIEDSVENTDHLGISYKAYKDINYQYMSEFPEEVQIFVRDSNVQQDNFNNLNTTLHSIRAFLDTQNLEYTIIPSLFTDPEYPEWHEIEFKIKIKKDLSFIYENVKPRIYDLIRSTIPSGLLDKILIDFDSF